LGHEGQTGRPDICLLTQRFSDIEEKPRGLQEEAKVAGINMMRMNATIEEKLNLSQLSSYSVVPCMEKPKHLQKD
jgi:hypothetical protein